MTPEQEHLTTVLRILVGRTAQMATLTGNANVARQLQTIPIDCNSNFACLKKLIAQAQAVLAIGWVGSYPFGKLLPATSVMAMLSLIEASIRMAQAGWPEFALFADEYSRRMLEAFGQKESETCRCE